MTTKAVIKITRTSDVEAKLARIQASFGTMTFAAIWDRATDALLGSAPVRLPLAFKVATDGARLKRARERAGLGQGRLAKKLGYEHRSSVGNIEIGRAPLVGAARAWVEAQEAAS